ncbi:uncharacterized protein ACA1_357840 [Acanthamoeba castellanii str. Neff]|uniref:t-SNARE coiled-coil homology domain-containing protein n=1 Tax=Acanthamoeba castellanii (strain ATCC 30010 / Neff) TaxID=1257118 RepID=L8HEH9_ACACF|nr:uncharacterized protein ACA1_357840 [Acanthamoeba castellanii str. Neff]ELR23173.1 hypothetical protein ACA1_357840 [Acanthamoeba castellanii str. Neff]
MAGKAPNTRSYGAAATAPPPSNYGGRGAYNPDSLFSGARDWQNDDVEALASDQRSRLLHTNERLDDHSDRLARAHRTALQSEQIGYEIQGQLREDREKLERAYGKMSMIT